MNQLHRLLDDQILQPLLLYGLLIAAFAPLGSSTFIVIVGSSSGACSAFAKHQCSALATEQLGSQQVFLICLSVSRCALVFLQTLLNTVKQVFRDDSRNRIWHNGIPERKLSNVTAVLQHGVHAAARQLSTQHITNAFCVEIVQNLNDFLTIIVALKSL